MKHQVCAFLLLVNFGLCADSDTHAIADKSQRIGRFSYEDSFDQNLVETVLKNSSAVVKKNIQRLLYPSHDEDPLGQRLLLLGGVSNASTNAIAKTVALRCGYEYYVVEAAALLREYREGRQMLLSEIRPIIKKGKPIAIIITELPEMADYSGLLASTLWLLIDQCAEYPDVLLIATSACEKEQLSEDVKERFAGNIISVSLAKSMEEQMENAVIQKPSWIERNKGACIVAGGLACFTLAAVHVAAQIFFKMAKTNLKKEWLEHEKQVAVNKFNQNERMLNVVTNMYNQFFNASEWYILKAVLSYGASVDPKRGAFSIPKDIELYDSYKNGQLNIIKKGELLEEVAASINNQE